MFKTSSRLLSVGEGLDYSIKTRLNPQGEKWNLNDLVKMILLPLQILKNYWWKEVWARGMEIFLLNVILLDIKISNKYRLEFLLGSMS